MTFFSIKTVNPIGPNAKNHIEKSAENKTMDIANYKIQGYSFLEKQSKSAIQEMIRACKDAYYNHSTHLITDNEYDILEDFYRTKWREEVTIGAEIHGKNKVKLPFEMASMDKIKPDSNALLNWSKEFKGPYLLSCKLDGVSGLYMRDESGQHHLYTRGDGHIGQNISHLIGPLCLPPLNKGTAIRGEFILPKSIFFQKYKAIFANARNTVSGMINRKGVDEKIEDLRFVTYELIQPSIPPAEQILYCKQHGLEIVQNIMAHQLSNEYLSSILIEWREKYEYEIDGVIVCSNHIYERVTGNPPHAFAFKMILSDQVAEAKVVDVIWSPSKAGYLKPRVQIEPIQLAGVRIEYATGFNGKFIQDNKIGLGAIITMVRSGDVIPYIKSVTKPAENARMPDVPYKWTDTMVDIILEDACNDTTVLEKNITHFFVTLEVDGLSSGNIKRIMKAGFQSISAILLANKSNFECVEGFKTKMIDKIYTSIQDKVGKATLLDIIVASGKMGRGLGKRKIAPILEKYPDILVSTDSTPDKIRMVTTVDGIGKNFAKEFISCIPQLMEFLKECGLEYKLSQSLLSQSLLSQSLSKGHIDVIQIQEPSKVDTSHLFYGKKVIMTKTRDKSVIEFIQSHGGILQETISKDTFLLIVKAEGDTSSKTEYAKKHGIPILSVAEFQKKYL